jgi:hypothetical protein
VLRRFPAILIDREALERFLEGATGLLPAGDTTTELTVRDGERDATFPTLRDLAADPDLPASLSNLRVDVLRRENGALTHEIRLWNDDGRATLATDGEYLWAHGAASVLWDLLEVYGKPVPAPALAPAASFNFFSAGVTLAIGLAASFYRGVLPGVAAVLTCGAIWFLEDLALSEIRLALGPRAPAPLAIEIRSPRRLAEGPAMIVRVWTWLRIAFMAAWLPLGYLVLAVVLRHVPKAW